MTEANYFSRHCLHAHVDHRIRNCFKSRKINFFLLLSECGGKMHLREGEFEKAHTDFFEAFKNYDESGSPRRTTCLKYLVLANM